MQRAAWPGRQANTLFTYSKYSWLLCQQRMTQKTWVHQCNGNGTIKLLILLNAQFNQVWLPHFLAYLNSCFCTALSRTQLSWRFERALHLTAPPQLSSAAPERCVCLLAASSCPWRGMQQQQQGAADAVDQELAEAEQALQQFRDLGQVSASVRGCVCCSCSAVAPAKFDQ